MMLISCTATAQLICAFVFPYAKNSSSHDVAHLSSKPTSNIKLESLLLLLPKRSTVMIQSFRTDRSGQTVQTQIRLLLEEQSDQGLHCLLFHLHLEVKDQGRTISLNFRVLTVKLVGVRKFRNFTVLPFTCIIFRASERIKRKF